MRGLDPRIQAPFLTIKSWCLNGRVKPGHDAPAIGFVARSICASPRRKIPKIRCAAVGIKPDSACFNAALTLTLSNPVETLRRPRAPMLWRQNPR
jgi:hypothetical protein